METDTINRRRFLRIDSNVIVKVEEISGDNIDNAISRNISEGGILFEYNRSFAIGTVLSLEIRLPEMGRRIECYGNVVRVQEVTFNQIYDIAVNFINIEKEDELILKQYIAMESE